MKLAFAIATIAALQQPPIIRAECEFGSNYTGYSNWSDFCSFDVGIGYMYRKLFRIEHYLIRRYKCNN